MGFGEECFHLDKCFHLDVMVQEFAFLLTCLKKKRIQILCLLKAKAKHDLCIAVRRN